MIGFVTSNTFLGIHTNLAFPITITQLADVFLVLEIEIFANAFSTIRVQHSIFLGRAYATFILGGDLEMLSCIASRTIIGIHTYFTAFHRRLA